MPIRKNAPMKTYIKDFEKSDAPQFKGKSKDKRVQMAVAAKLQSMDKKKMEEYDYGTVLSNNLMPGADVLKKYVNIVIKDPKIAASSSEQEFTNSLRDKVERAHFFGNKDEVSKAAEYLLSLGNNAGKYSNTMTRVYSMIKGEMKEAKGTLCGRCGHVHVKGTPCPRPFKEGAKPDFLDLDKDGNTKEPMKKAAKDSKLKHEVVANVLGKIKEAVVTDDAKEAERITKSGTEVKLVPKGSIKEGMERDYEGKMAKAQLISIVKNAKDLFDSMDDNTQLKAWIQSKLTKAEDYISSVRTYLDGESLSTTTPLIHNGEAVKDDQGAALNIGDVVKAADGKIYQVVFSYSEGKPFLTPFDLKRRKPVNLRERHYFDNVAEGSQEGMPLAIKTSKVLDASATKGGFMR